MKWNLEEIYTNFEEWEKELKTLDAYLDKVPDFARLFKKERLTNVKKFNQDIFEYLTLQFEFSLKLEKLYSYAFLFKDINMDNEKSFEMLERVTLISTEFSALTSFFEPDILEFSVEEFMKIIVEDDRLDRYHFMFSELFRAAKHVLTEEEEFLLSKTNALNNSYEIFESLNEIDLKFEDIVFEDGHTEELNHSSYSTFLMHPDQKIRQQAFDKMYKAYSSLNATFANIFIANIKEFDFYRDVKNFETPLDAALFHNAIPTYVYKNLIDSVNANLPSFHRYTKLRKKALDLNEIHLYDFLAPISESDASVSFEDALKSINDSLSVLGEDYVDTLKRSVDEKWVDVYPKKNKTSGAYSFGPNSLEHPYVLLNQTDDYDGMFTIAHEFGHMMHSYYSNLGCDPLYASYSIFVAEVASTVNEVLLMLHLLEKADAETKKFLICEFLDKFKSTFFRQTQFAEFEMIVHDMIANDMPLSKTALNQIYLGLNEKYFGKDVVIDEAIQYEWSRIPHFYSSFYVYQYATGFAAAIDIATRIHKGEEGIVDRYRKFLSLGGSDYPIEVLKVVGVDFSTSKTIDNAFVFYENLLDKFEHLV